MYFGKTVKRIADLVKVSGHSVPFADEKFLYPTLRSNILQPYFFEFVVFFLSDASKPV